MATAAPPQPVQADQPAPSNKVQSGPAPSRSRVFAAVSLAWHTMTSTVYSHKYSENRATGVYQFDCVGLVSYFLKLAAPKANTAMRTTLKIKPGYVASPPLMMTYLQSVSSPYWKVISNLAAIEPGDVIVMNSITNPDDGTPGHAMIAASTPFLLSNGTYGITVYDSTGTGHGPDDSRHWDTRTTPLPPKSTSGAPTKQQTTAGTATSAAATTRNVGSGLGFGTIQLWSAAVSNLTPASEQMSWTVATKPIATGIIVGRATG